MDIEKFIALCVGLGVPTLVQVSPLKINPWSWLLKMMKWIWQGFCRSLNAEVLNKLTEVEKAQNDVKEKLESHIRILTITEIIGLQLRKA